MSSSANDVCIRLRWYLRLCEKYLCTSIITEKPDKYIIRYIVIGLRNLISSSSVMHSDVSNLCSSNLLKYLDELGVQFLYAKYGYLDDSSILSFLKLFCSCLGKAIKLRC